MKAHKISVTMMIEPPIEPVTGRMPWSEFSVPGPEDVVRNLELSVMRAVEMPGAFEAALALRDAINDGTVEVVGLPDIVSAFLQSLYTKEVGVAHR